MKKSKKGRIAKRECKTFTRIILETNGDVKTNSAIHNIILKSSPAKAHSRKTVSLL